MKTHDPRSCGYYTATHGPFTTAAAAHVHLVADHCARMRVLPHCGVRQHGCNKRAVTALLEIAHVLRWVFVPLVPHFAPVFFCQVHEARRSEEHTSELQSRGHLVCRLLLEKKKNKTKASMY